MQFLNVKRLDIPVGSLKHIYNKAPDQRSWVTTETGGVRRWFLRLVKKKKKKPEQEREKSPTHGISGDLKK